MRSRPSDAAWMGCAFGVAFGLAAVVLVALGAAERGIDAALLATARLAFLLFWPAYAGAALVRLFGASFQPVKRHGRSLGLAFASVMSVHLGLVAWLCLIGHAPSAQTFLIFGTAVAWTCLLALFSFGAPQRALGAAWPTFWWVIRVVGMNYVAFAFALDFLRDPLLGGIKPVVGYLPFASLAVAGPCLRLAALGQRVAHGLAQSSYRTGQDPRQLHRYD